MSCEKLPSPISPSTVETPPLFPLASSLSVAASNCLSGKPGVAPLQSFVQELIRRSRTSGIVVQTALCYIEAVHQKLPEIASTPTAPAKEAAPEESSQDDQPVTPGPLAPSPLLYPTTLFGLSQKFVL